MPGLSFLSKKSWHTSNISNQEKVWIAEQKAAAEEAKLKELTHQPDFLGLEEETMVKIHQHPLKLCQPILQDFVNRDFKWRMMTKHI
jgi:hypothetical protein